MLALACSFANAQIEPTLYRGAFAPNTAMWTDSWTNWNPNSEAYTDAATVVNVTADITTNTTWVTGRTYKLNGLIYVKNNATLTIQPGVIVKGVYSSTGTALVITKGAKINAVGTATSPIVFTSAKSAGSRAAGDWGGIILLGKAGFNLNNGINNIEGIAATVNTEYGGGTTPDDADNSGTLKYVRIEFGGYVFSPNNEINGLTFGAVGSGTTIDYVQVSHSGDDSFEWFGGAVNCKHIVAYKGLDDDFDTDNGYKGIVQFALGVRDPNIADNPAISTSEGFESDNNATTAEAATGYSNTTAIFTNCTLIGPSKRATTVAAGYARALRLRRSTELKVYNSIFLDFKNNYAGLTDDQTIAKYYAGKLKLKNNIFAGFYGSDFTSFPKGINPTDKTGNATTNALGLPTNTAFNLSAKMAADGNTTISSSTDVLAGPYATDLSVYSGLDYRPGTAASTGADFTDSSMAPYIINPSLGDTPVVANVNYCVGAVASPLTAALTSTGVSLKWYAAATGGIALKAVPTPVTKTVGTTTYYVSQMSTLGFESNRVALTVTVNEVPTEVISVITGTGPVGSVSAVAVGKYVGTGSTFKYSVTAFSNPSLSYLWTVPNGVTITNGQGTNEITVNYLNEPVGAGAVGTISVQAVNASGCKTIAKSLAITKALPTSPAAIAVTDSSLPLPATGVYKAITSVGKYIGTTTPVTLTATAVNDAAKYSWELPAGVNIVIGTAGPTAVRYFTALPFTTPLLAKPSPSPAIGTKYWKVTTTSTIVNVNGVTTVVYSSTATQIIHGNATGAYPISEQAYLPFGTVITSDKNAILVNFSGVNAATTTLYLGVKAISGVGESISTKNATNVDVVANNTSIPGLFATTYTELYTAPVAPSTNATSVFTVGTPAIKTSTLLKLTAALPLAPKAITLTNDAVSTTAKVTAISKFVGTTTPFTLTATASDAAASYLWDLPAGVNKISGGNSNVITVNFAGVTPGVKTLNVGVKAVNALGSSSTVNKAPNAESTFTLLSLTTALPTPPTAVAGQLLLVCGNGTPYEYTITPSVLANSYIITAPEGSVVTSASAPTNASNVLETSDLVFTVVYHGLVAPTVAAKKTITIFSKNGVGTSVASKALTLTTSTCSATPRLRNDVVSATEVYPNPVSSDFNIDVTASKAGVLEIGIYSLDGTAAVSPRLVKLQENANTITENVSSLKKGIYIVRLVNTSNNEVITKKLIKN